MSKNVSKIMSNLTSSFKNCKKDKLCGHWVCRVPRQGNLHKFLKLILLNTEELWTCSVRHSDISSGSFCKSSIIKGILTLEHSHLAHTHQRLETQELLHFISESGNLSILIENDKNTAVPNNSYD